jgi:hypothetical protein
MDFFQPRSAEVNSAPLPESFGFSKASMIPPGRPGPGRLLFQQPAERLVARQRKERGVGVGFTDGVGDGTLTV